MTSAPATTTTAREYLRVSQDRSGVARSTDEQHFENTASARDNGWPLGTPYLDVDRSASRYATKVREGYDLLTADLEADRFGAGVLILWESSRGSRRVSEWVRLLELLEARHVLVHVTSHGRTYDPANPRDRKSLLEDSVDSEYESGKTSMRGRRAAAASAASGKPNGRAPWGYRRDYEYTTVNGKQVRTVHQTPDEAPVFPGEKAPAALVRELFARVNAGASMRSLERDWEARGIVNRSGRPFTAQHLRSMLMTRAYVGERVHNPGARSGNAGRGAAAVVVSAGQWEPLVDRATFLSVQAILSDPARRTSRPGRGVHLLSMIAACDVCGGPLAVSFRRPEGQYVCRDSGHVRISKPDLDRFATSLMLAYLSAPDEYPKIVANEDDDAALVRARADVAAIRAELDDLGDQVGAGTMSASLAARAEPGIQARLAKAVEVERDLSTPSRLRALIEPGPGVEQRWEAALMSTRREVARLLLARDDLGELRVRRSTTPGHAMPVAERVRLLTSARP